MKKILIPVLILVSALAAVAALPKLKKIWTAPAEEAATFPLIPPMPVYDQQADSLFDDLASLYNRIGDMRQYLAEGSIQLADHADTSRSISTKFRYCHTDSMNYYQLGDQEMIAVPGLYISVQHSVKKIMISPREQGRKPFQVFIDHEQIEALKKEGYSISKEDGGQLSVIRLQREKHISCREYRVSYDSAGLIRRIFMRSAHETVPEDLTLDKYISVNIHRWQTNGLPLHVFNVEKYIVKKGDEWVPAKAFAGYEIKYVY